MRTAVLPRVLAAGFWYSNGGRCVWTSKEVDSTLPCGLEVWGSMTDKH